MNRGQQFECRAAHFLRAAGLDLVERNFRCRLGEIDLICRDGDVWVFVEVRYRSHPLYATAADSVGRAKQRRLRRTVRYYLQRRGIFEHQPCRIDVVAFDGWKTADKDGIQWLKNAVTE